VQIKIEVRGQEEGEYQAFCPEAGVACRGRSLEDVLQRITDLVVFYFSALGELEGDDEEQAEVTKQLSFHLKGKNLFVPRNPKVH